MRNEKEVGVLNVTIICDVLGKPNNGTALAAFNLIAHLKSAGHSVTVVAPDAPDGEGFVSVPRLNLGPLNRILDKNGVSLAKPDKKLLEAALKDADVVHLLLPFPLSCFAIKAADRLGGKPLTASFHCQAENVTAHFGMMDMPHVNHLIYKIFDKLVYRHVDAIHYPTEFIRETFEHNIGRKTNAYVISNGVNDMFFKPEVKPETNGFNIVCSGRYCREKAQGQLMRAVALSKYRDKIHLTFAGEGPDRKKLVRLAKKLGLDCRFSFFKREELVKVLQSADLYVHTAVVEIEAIACMEAICCGAVPLICNSKRSATRFFALSEDNLFEPYNYTELSEKLDMWLSSPEKCEECSRRYRDTREKFDQTECMKKMENMLLETVKKH